MRSIRDIKLLENIPVLVRAPLNVPIENGGVANDYRLRRAIPTIQFLATHGARVILISHIGEKGAETLAPVADALAKLIPNVSFCAHTIGPAARDAVRALAPGHVLVLENLRRHKGERDNDPAFAKDLAALADAFVEDSFDTCHRAHASIVGVPKLLPSYAGLLLEEEMAALTAALTPKHPSLAVIGGAKFSTKEGVLMKLLERYDHVLIGGALASDFLKASGQEVGKSLVSEADLAHVRALLSNERLVLPSDALVVAAADVGAADARARARVVTNIGIGPDDVILDEGPATSAHATALARAAKSVLWNGPLGNYENGFIDATDSLARAVAATSAHSVVGGGDTIASIENLGLLAQFSFVSTGGGAMLDFLAQGTLPGIQALENATRG
ncbi:MAG TPA: phosphoglycerate kinase [Candidatus Paceibacterota bacterium]|nr:phosphoglycerate kinase [Candidatus Paceibacterota bacterium]